MHGLVSTLLENTKHDEMSDRDTENSKEHRK